MYDIHILCQQYINILYKNILRRLDRQNKNIAETYGEVLYSSVDKLITTLAMTEQDAFFDLGSGLGKLTIQVFLKSAVKEACGIEIIPELYQHSLRVAHKIQNDLPEFYAGQRKLTFLLGSFLDISLAQATIVFIGSPCFSQKILYPLGNKINSTSSIHTVLSLRPIPNLKRLVFVKTLRLECSWDTALCYVYRAR